MTIQEAKLNVAQNDLNVAQAQLDAKQAELDKVQALYDKAVQEKQVTLLLSCSEYHKSGYCGKVVDFRQCNSPNWIQVITKHVETTGRFH